MINIPIKEFKENWQLVTKGKEMYSNSNEELIGSIVFETDEYMVIKIFI